MRSIEALSVLAVAFPITAIVLARLIRPSFSLPFDVPHNRPRGVPFSMEMRRLDFHAVRE